MDKKVVRKARLPFRGQALFYLLKKLPNHGVGRLIIRGSVRQEAMKPTYMRILSVDMKPIQLKKRKKKHQNIPAINVIVEKTHAGFTIRKEQNLRNVSHLADFLLIPKEEEERYLKNSVVIPEPKGHYHLSSSLRASIKKLVEEGMSLVDARKMVMEKQNARLAEKDIAAQGDTVGADGNEYDEELDEDDDDDCNLRGTEERPQHQHSSRNMQNNGRSEQNVSFSLEEDKLGDFTEVELQRINNMIRNGVNLDTARQLEWERKIAFENKNLLKRDMPKSHWTSATNGGKNKSAKYN